LNGRLVSELVGSLGQPLTSIVAGITTLRAAGITTLRAGSIRTAMLRLIRSTTAVPAHELTESR
jgi:hypothetical protein